MSQHRQNKNYPLIQSKLIFIGMFFLLILAGNSYAAKPPPIPLSCSISPADGTATAGTGVTFNGSADGGAKGGKNYSWDFSDGSGSPASATTSSVNVTYNTSGTFNVLLSVSDKNNTVANCSTTISVAGSANQAPVANDDTATTDQNTPVNINVVANDTDADGTINPATVVVSQPSNGGTFANNDGTVDYTPAQDFTGNDSFTYTVKDNLGVISNTATVTITVNSVGGGNTISINSTSQNGVPINPVPEQAITNTNDHVILAINDLGMHCGDLDTRVSSILPPFNVLHAQVIQRGINSTPRIMTEADNIEVIYSAASNPDDPALSGNSSTGQPLLNSKNNSGEVYKTNFWELAIDSNESIALKAYRPFYPSGILDAFDPSAHKGLPMPDVERLYLGDGNLAADTQVMPGHADAYIANETERFEQFVGSMPFFTSFPFGYVAENVNWFEAAGIPLATFDDSGVENTYPLLRVQAKGTGVDDPVLATIDTVAPISGEANCQGCHGAIVDGGNGVATEALASVATTINDPKVGSVPLAISQEFAADLNILRLHDQKHLTSLEANRPVVCQSCHYTPALDLAQLGPLGPENDGPLILNGQLISDSLANGRDQVKNKSMSNVMHSHHGSINVIDNTDGTVSIAQAGDTNVRSLFPSMEPPVTGGNLRDPIAADNVLQETCYQCHPGRRTDCLRGAMASGGMLCQDCHGDMAQVGDDFTRGVDPAHAGAFELAGDFYTNPDTPRVPWANEPGCGSCHTGDALDNMHSDADTIGSLSDAVRLMQAWRVGDAKATPIVPTNKRFAEDVVATGDAAGNPKLYRVSTGGQVLSDLGSAGVQKSGHAGLFCEACHGATHAIWPNANPNANDNVASQQLQQHAGTITECSVCHEPNDDSLPLGLGGPHGMHPIVANGDDRWNFNHNNYGGSSNNNCRTCHGTDLKGTVLSRTAADRIVQCKNDQGTLCDSRNNLTATIPKGTEVGCGLCHKQKR